MIVAPAVAVCVHVTTVGPPALAPPIASKVGSNIYPLLSVQLCCNAFRQSLKIPTCCDPTVSQVMLMLPPLGVTGRPEPDAGAVARALGVVVAVPVVVRV